MTDVQLIAPTLERLGHYAEALERGWAPDNVRGRAGAEDHLRKIAEDPAAFVASLDDPQARAGPITLPDGSVVERLPGYQRWIWDGEFCGTVGFRWRPGTADLPPHVMGHIGYGVTSWKQRRGYATRGLALMLPNARALGMAYVELTTEPENLASRRVIEANGGVLFERFAKPSAYGGGEGLRYRIAL